MNIGNALKILYYNLEISNKFEIIISKEKPTPKPNDDTIDKNENETCLTILNLT
jgi:hypothetical protein